MRIPKAVVAGVLALTIAFGGVACADGKPSKAAMREALKSRGSGGTGLSGEEADKMIDCLVDEMHPKLSPEAITAIIEGRTDFELSDADAKVTAEASAKCVR